MFSTLGVDPVPVNLAATSINVNLAELEPAGTLPEEAADPEHDNDGKGEVGLEEALGSVDTTTKRPDGGVELLEVWSAKCRSAFKGKMGILT